MYNLKLYQNVDCQRPPTYNVRWFSTISEQNNYFASKVSLSEIDCSPYKGKDGVIRVGANVDTLRNYPYLSYQLNNGKVVYAFIDNVTYLNEEVTDVSITIDAFQTYMFQLKIGACFVEREHVVDDTRGKNIIPEKLAVGEYQYDIQKYSGLFNYADYHIILATTETEQGTPNYGKIYNSIYSGVNYIDFARDIGSLNGFIDNLVTTNKKDSILGIYMCPVSLINFGIVPKVLSFELPDQPNTFGGYTPKNNKLYTYPYSFITMTNGNGQTMELKYEYLDTLQMNVEFSTGINMEVYAFPNQYDGIAFNRIYKLKINNFPMCAFTVDSYQAWLAQNQGYFKQTMTNAITTAGMGFAMGGGAGAVVGALTSVSNAMIKNEQQSSLPEVVHGTSSGNAEFANGTMDFVAYTTRITAQMAKSIDDYFTRYGYQVNEYKVPNLTTHSMFNFVKTSDCSFTGNMPANYLQEIVDSFNRGITLWHTSFQGVTNYSDNEVLK